MKRLLLDIYRIIILRSFRKWILKESIHRRILKYFDSLPQNEIKDEQREVIDFLKNNKPSIFPYPFQFQYSPESVKVFEDKLHRMHYVMFDNKKLYFRQGWTKKRIKKGFSDLLTEQDINSPHRYLNGFVSLSENDVVADIGAAEGNFSLSVIEKIRKLYIFENNPEWVKALKLTFEPWKDKVEIICKRVADYEDDKNIKFDTFMSGREKATFFKIDVEGAEEKVLNSCRKVLEGKDPVKIALCTYHRNDDEKDFTKLLTRYGFTVKLSKGYMVLYDDKKIKPPYLRRGLIMANRH
jgi:hypothetical protein